MKCVVAHSRVAFFCQVFLLDKSEVRGMKMDKKEATKEKEMAKWRNGEMKY